MPADLRREALRLAGEPRRPSAYDGRQRALIASVARSSAPNEIVVAKLVLIRVVPRDPAAPVSSSPHALRHSHALHLPEAGAKIKYASERLGHASVKVTADTYLHVTKKIEDDALALYTQYVD
jgi:integrase